MTGNSYYFRKIHSLLGVIPVGFFLIEHLLTNYSAVDGHAAFVKQIDWLNSLPLVLFLEIFGIWLPLLYHGVYGLYVAYQSRNNVSNYGYFRNQMFFLQRVTGVLTFIFVAWHFFETRFQVSLGNVSHGELGITMHNITTNPVLFTIYVIGIIAAVFHFSNGMWSFLVSWGITVGPRAQRISTYVWLGVFVVMSVMFIMSLTAFTDTQFERLPAASSHIGLNG
ncbi:succinate dehydrogenase cytochrome b558 subunit [Paenibacillus sp. GP183]|jgi:succinate dehydrogenase / fumarate reductase, cytochrome b subunit|uniref:succinate dehydrogenase cytochrome b558 subunit n=1 Tax=Paenibacillus sp. GP183 TaxID=1882751 RepID=UPI0008993F71|nr:succinate dehydrogenase cytochrome b558 subunit [Paenibacillus sp. GP183]SEC66947.1 succinate dehydrogenase subunit C [Paenibacillus sp. GP183]